MYFLSTVCSKERFDQHSKHVIDDRNEAEDEHSVTWINSIQYFRPWPNQKQVIKTRPIIIINEIWLVVRMVNLLVKLLFFESGN